MSIMQEWIGVIWIQGDNNQICFYGWPEASLILSNRAVTSFNSCIAHVKIMTDK